MTDSNVGLTPEQVECFARGLYHLANVDGIDDRETKLIEEFLQDASSELTLADLETGGFSLAEAAGALETSFLKRIFIKTAIALVKADGVFSDAERHAVGEIADAFGLSNAEFGDIEQDAMRGALE